MAATAKEQSQKRSLLSLSFWHCSSISLLGAMYVVHFPFGATMEFSDRESSPDPSRSDGSSVEFVAETLRLGRSPFDYRLE